MQLIPTIEKKIKPSKPRYIKPHSLKLLELSYFDWKYRHSSIPTHCRFIKRFRDDSANNLTNCIQAWCKVYDAHFQRMNSQGQYDARLKIWRKSGSTKGVSDALLVYQGKTIHIEIKYGKDKQSNVQKDMQSSIEASGGICWVIKSYDGFIDQIDNLK